MTNKEIKAARHLEKLAQKSQGKSTDTMKWIILAIGSILFITFFAFVVYLIKQSQNKPVVISSKSGYVIGSDTAKVTLIEYGDFQCPACRAYEPSVRQLIKEFGEKKLKFVYKNFPLTSVHPNAMLAARAAVAAGEQNKFFEMHNWLYDNQDSWASLSGVDARAKIVDAAKSLVLKIDQFNKDMDSKKVAGIITASQNEGISIGVNSTPTFYLNNKKIDKNPQNYEDFKKIVQAEVK